MKIIGLWILVLMALAAQLVQAGTAEPTSFTRQGILSYHFHSELLGRGFVIDVLLPLTYNPEANTRYPVIYMTDGFMHFPMTAPNLIQEQIPDARGKAKIPPVILVGISHPTDSSSLRMRLTDFTPVPGEIQGALLGGGADRFLEFIQKELKPFINNAFMGDENDETVAGHALGGLFALHTLFNHTDSFDRYVIGSPSIWWAGKQILESEVAYAERHSDLPKNVYLFIGGEETCMDDMSVCGVRDFGDMLQRLESRNYNSLSLTKRIFERENHGTVVNPGYDKGLEQVFKSQLRPRKYSF
ncbi:alpha/beta hydrolase [Microbulbifer sp. 2205BS26-8]|uniref:alpha/beta hydrolase n=1 Tax=Microbulbifer sp. 2205BS26-8 TaxID=3064386 RepID=UPI00273E95CA|nr:alpha/beta hydrolase-fold protein [Microbulbifer sp. 2205BS26-8]MDP5209894.1 alpha/beta hydrolase-fold protein [Microbulbifer sp. 2205BS26-8]